MSEPETPLFDIEDGKYGRSTRNGHRHDELLAQAEIDRARAENREPDFSNLGPSVASVLVERKDLPTSQYTDRTERFTEDSPSHLVKLPKPVVTLTGPRFEGENLNPASQPAAPSVSDDSQGTLDLDV